MKLRFLQTLAMTLALAFVAVADDHHGHNHAKAGPTGGKLLTKVEPHAEFFVTADKKIEIRFLDESNKVIEPKDQVVTVTMGDRSAPTRLEFTREGDKLISAGTIPEGNRLPTVVQIKADAEAKTVNERFNLDLADCPTCENAEYACICSHDHGHDHKKGHSHDHKEGGGHKH